MLFLLFQLGDDRYALDALQVAEVVPLVNLKQLPQSSAGIAGAFDYHGTPVPVIDLSALVLHRPARVCLSTRIILVHYPDSQGDARLLGLMAERATETTRRAPEDFGDAGVTQRNAPYLGRVASDACGLIQWIEVDRLLPTSVRDTLFQPTPC